MLHHQKNWQRNEKGTLVTWLLVLAIFGLTFVMTLISLELLIKWITFNRIQEAAQSAALSYAREMIKLRDNEMGENQKYALEFKGSKSRGCSRKYGYEGCTDYDGEKVETDIEKAEYISASQILLFNIWDQGKKPIKDAFSIKNVRQGQCYSEPSDTRFNKFGESKNLRCEAIGNVVSPITSLNWAFHAGTYSSPNKDLCVETHVSARLDPVMAGGLCFLNGSCGLGADFIKIGPVNVVARAVVMKAGFKVDTGEGFSRQKTDRFYEDGAENYSAESVFIETCSNPAECAKQAGECQIDRGSGVSVPFPINSLEAPPAPLPLPTPPGAPPVVSPPGIPTPPAINPPVIPPVATSTPAETPKPSSTSPIDPNCIFIIDRNSGTNKFSGQAMEFIKYISTQPIATNYVYKAPRGQAPAPAKNIAMDDAGSSIWLQLEQVNSEFQDLSIRKAWNALISQSNSRQHIGMDGYFDSQGVYTAIPAKDNTDGENYVDPDLYYKQNLPAGKTICGKIQTPTPIQLIWSKDKESEIKATQFPINPNYSGKWFTWTTCSARPLLVLDPKHKGKITSPSQLFGNYSSGKTWANGYEALSQLDTNKDNLLSNSELNDLALWFDHNQDGISQNGEVKKLSSVGVTKLFVQPNRTALSSGELYADIGYERVINGKKLIGSSVDWLSKGPFDTKEEALNQNQYIPFLGFAKSINNSNKEI